jgi:hypothetical protein
MTLNPEILDYGVVIDDLYCPLCGAHKFEYGEGKATDADVLRWAEEIGKLFDRLIQVKQEAKRSHSMIPNFDPKALYLTQETGEDLTMSDTKLEKFGMTNAEFGKALLDSAQNAERKKFVDNSTAEVQRLLGGIDRIKANIKRDEENLEIYQDRLLAIEKGEFSFAPQGSQFPLVYKYERLNKQC